MRLHLPVAAIAASLFVLAAPQAKAMCANGVCGLESGPVQAQGEQVPGGQGQAGQGQAQSPGHGGMSGGTAMGGMNMGGQRGGGMQGVMMNCPMMKQMASLQERVRMMEDMMGMTKQN